MKTSTEHNELEGGLAAIATLDKNVFQAQIVKNVIPTDWTEQAKKAWEYFLHEPIISNTINSWRVFAMGDELKITCEDESIEDEAVKLFKEHNLNRFINDMILQLLVKGDAIGYLNRTSDGRNIEKVTCVNPVSVKLKFENGELVKAVQSNETGNGTFTGDEIELALDQMVHLKWNAPEYAPRGNSMILPAFESIELLRDYRKAERAIAKRWTTPLRFIQVGGHYGNKTIIPDNAMMERIKNELNRMDLEAGLVVPFYVKAETYEGKTLETEAKVKEIKEDILIALGMARSVVAGDGPNFATASISMQKMIVQLKEIKRAARQVLDWIFDEWKDLKGYQNKDIIYHFNDLDLHNEADIKKVFLEMYDRGLICKKTLQTKMGLDPDAEESGKEDEEIVLDTNWNVQDIVQLVSLDILSPATAREMLGIDEDKNEEEPESETVDAMYRKLKNVNTKSTD